tara:strand:+ start:41624 stop:43396 length:1773 start_codon:yes stop_codon:yes gene_type:complete
MADDLDFFNKEFDSLNRNDIFYTETHPVCSNNFLDFNQALIDVINEKNITLSELSAIQGPFVTFNELDVNLLDRSDYIDYTKDGENNLKLPFDNQLVAKTIGTDYYYLSTDSQYNSVSGIMFEATNKVNNLLNINHPTTLSISTSSQVFERDISYYFRPTDFSVLKMQGEFDFVKKDNLKDNNVYMFPDPNNYGSVSWLGKSPRPSPFDFILKEDIYKNKSSSFGVKNTKSTNKNQNFYSYDTLEQKRYKPNYLSSFPTKYPEKFNNGIIENVNYDIYGNEFIEYINTKSVIENKNNDSYIQDRTIFTGSNTIVDQENVNGTIETKKDFLTNKLSVKNVFTFNLSSNKFEPISAAFNDVFKKYNYDEKLYDELNNSIININLYEDVFSITTPSYNVIDSYVYNGEFIQDDFHPLILEYGSDDSFFNKVSNDYLIGSKIYKVETSLLPQASATNDILIYEIYNYDITTNKIDKILDKNKKSNNATYYDNFNFDLPVKPKYIKNINITYSSKLEVFNITTQINDLCDNFYINSVLYKVIDDVFYFYENDFYQPDNFFATTNFYLSGDFTRAYTFASLSGSPTQDKLNGILYL